LIGQAGNTTIVISSHEMAEVEGLATEVAYLDRGCLTFQQPTEALLARFRHVTVTLDQPPPSFDDLPGNLLLVQGFERTIKFIDPQFPGEAPLRKEISEYYGPIEHFEAERMSLREVSKALMLDSRGGLAQ